MIHSIEKCAKRKLRAPTPHTISCKEHQYRARPSIKWWSICENHHDHIGDMCVSTLQELAWETERIWIFYLAIDVFMTHDNTCFMCPSRSMHVVSHSRFRPQTIVSKHKWWLVAEHFCSNVTKQALSYWPFYNYAMIRNNELERKNDCVQYWRRVSERGRSRGNWWWTTHWTHTIFNNQQRKIFMMDIGGNILLRQTPHIDPQGVITWNGRKKTGGKITIIKHVQ